MAKRRSEIIQKALDATDAKGRNLQMLIENNNKSVGSGGQTQQLGNSQADAQALYY